MPYTFNSGFSRAALSMWQRSIIDHIRSSCLTEYTLIDPLLYSSLEIYIKTSELLRHGLGK